MSNCSERTFCSNYAANRAFLSGKYFSISAVVRYLASLVWLRPLFSRDVNKPTMQNTRDANDHAHAKRFARKKRSVSRVATTNNTQEIAHKQNTFGRRMYGITTCRW